ncbi:LPS translocon maturation chaperone LptM [Shewanella sp.]|uniref:LPS translocon maturation chaperone LptM n=1 Tax=Shewanella sp. TaxID=50422 RepID=UPI003A982466
MLSEMKRLLSLMMLSLLLVGCGQKGPLYKTPTKTPTKVQASGNTAPQPTAQGE